jgi:hypothetical protein
VYYSLDYKIQEFAKANKLRAYREFHAGFSFFMLVKKHWFSEQIVAKVGPYNTKNRVNCVVAINEEIGGKLQTYLKGYVEDDFTVISQNLLNIHFYSERMV